MSAVMYPGWCAMRRAAADGVLCAAAAGDADDNSSDQRACMGSVNAADGCAACVVGLGLDAGLFGGLLAKRVYCHFHKLGVLSLFPVQKTAMYLLNFGEKRPNRAFFAD